MNDLYWPPSPPTALIRWMHYYTSEWLHRRVPPRTTHLLSPFQGRDPVSRRALAAEAFALIVRKLMRGW